MRIRELLASDCQQFEQAFKAQGWDKPAEQFERYLNEHAQGVRRVFVAELGGQPAGYVTLLPRDEHGPYRDIPTVCDFNVLERYQGKGIGSQLLDAVEQAVIDGGGKEICLGVGLHAGYGLAQRLYVKRGYVPDGSGVWFNNTICKPYTSCENNDDLVLYLSKSLG